MTIGILSAAKEGIGTRNELGLGQAWQLLPDMPIDLGLVEDMVAAREEAGPPVVLVMIGRA